MTNDGARGLDRLKWAYQNRHASALAAYDAGTPVVGVTSPTAPFELIMAAGMFPLLLSPPVSGGSAGGTAPHNEFMEDVFDLHTESVFDFLQTDAAQFLSAVIIPRTSDRDHKLFLYLRELQRQGVAERLPKLFLYNLLHSQNEDSRHYSINRTHELKGFLEQTSAREITDSSMRESIATGNEARRAARDFQKLRETPIRLSGADALAALGARHFMGWAEYARDAQTALTCLQESTPLGGPRICIAGYPLQHDNLHRELERRGAVVVCEDGAYGSGAATPDIDPNSDPLTAIGDHYQQHVVSPRQAPRSTEHLWPFDQTSRVDGVVFYLPPADEVYGWNYPSQAAHLDQLQTPHYLVRSDAQEIGDNDQASDEGLTRFVEQLSNRTVA